MTTYNHEKYIAEAIQSVLDQTFTDFELVIVNDGSNDRTEEIIKSFNDPRIKYIYQENMGPSACANTAIKNAKGKYIALMSGDDVCYPERLEVQYNEYIKDKSRLLFAWCDFIDDDSKIIIKKDHFDLNYFNRPNKNRAEILRYFFFYGNCLNAVTCFTEKKVFDTLGEFDIRLLQSQDFEMWIRALLFGYDVEIVQKKLIKYRISANDKNLSADTIETAERRLFEYKQVMKSYFEIKDIELFYSIFPEIKEKYKTINILDIPYLLLKLSFDYSISIMMHCAKEVFYNKFDLKYYNYLNQKFFFTMKEFYEYTNWGELCQTRSELKRIVNSNTYRIAVKLEKVARKTGLIYLLKFLLKIYGWFKN